MQFRYKTGLTSEEYVNQQAWRLASLERCPIHPRGGCGFSSHGTYERDEPLGTRIPRWYCPEGKTTFSLLADCFASRLPGTLQDVEEVVAEVEVAEVEISEVEEAAAEEVVVEEVVVEEVAEVEAEVEAEAAVEESDEQEAQPTESNDEVMAAEASDEDAGSESNNPNSAADDAAEEE